ncbi:MAG: hypothetical protein ACRDVG_01715 [Jatrophihabitantaceae bacterium]
MTSHLDLTGITVFGEPAAEIAATMSTFVRHSVKNGRVKISGTSDGSGPFLRAMYRAEAELLRADADAMADGTYEHRTPAQRRHDALLLIVETIGSRATTPAHQAAS